VIECVRVRPVTPFIFAQFLKVTHCRAESVARINEEFQIEIASGIQFRAIIVRLFVFSATNSYLVAKSSLTAVEQSQLARNMILFRQYLQRFVKLTGTLKDEAAGDKMTKRPNMHQAMHVSKYLGDYATTKNCDVSRGETKHRQLKDKAQHANKVHVDKQIMLDIARKEAIRMIATEDRLDTHPEISTIFQTLHNSCPSLFAKIIPWNLEEFEIDEAEQSLVGHGTGQPFANLAVNRTIPRWQAKFPVTLVEGTHFYNEVTQAYHRDYNIRLDDVQVYPHVCYRGRAFTVIRDTETKLVFQCGRWIQYGNTYAQVRAVFTHLRLDETRVFFILYPANFIRHDDLVDCDVYSVQTTHAESSYRVVGLPAVAAVEFFHFVQIGNNPHSTHATHHRTDIVEYWHNYRLQHFL
jgi:hypothetical protein